MYEAVFVNITPPLFLERYNSRGVKQLALICICAYRFSFFNIFTLKGTGIPQRMCFAHENTKRD